MKKRAILMLAVMLCVAAVLAGCGGSGNNGGNGQSAGKSNSGKEETGATDSGTGGTAADKDKKFTIRVGAWFIDEREHQVAYKKAIEEAYKKLYPNATIQWDITLGATYFDKLKAQFASDTAPDVTFYQSLDYIKAGNLLDLSDEPWVARMTESAKKDPSLAYEGKLYGAPGAGNIGGGIWYNKDLFEKLNIQTPKTVDDFMAAAETIKAAGKTPIALGFKDLWTASMFLTNWLQSYTFPNDADYGKKLYDGTIKFDDTVIQTVFQNIGTMKAKGYFNKNALSIDWPQSAQLFASGDAAMIVQGPWMPSANAENIQKGGYTSFHIGFFPFMDDKGSSSLTFTSGTGLGINAKTKLVQESKDLINLMVSPEIMAPWLAGEGGLPMFSDITVNYADPVMDTVKQYLDTGLTLPYGIGNFMPTSSSNALVDIVTKVVSGVSFNPADLKTVQDNMEKDKASVVLPQ